MVGCGDCAVVDLDVELSLVFMGVWCCEGDLRFVWVCL